MLVVYNQHVRTLRPCLKCRYYYTYIAEEVSVDCRTDYPYTYIILESLLSLAEHPDKDQTWPNVSFCIKAINGT